MLPPHQKEGRFVLCMMSFSSLELPRLMRNPPDDWHDRSSCHQEPGCIVSTKMAVSLTDSETWMGPSAGTVEPFVMRC